MKNILVLLFCLLFVQTHLYSAELAKDGATDWKIVLPNEPTIVEKTAARELSEHLKLVTCASQKLRPCFMARTCVGLDRKLAILARRASEGIAQSRCASLACAAG